MSRLRFMLPALLLTLLILSACGGKAGEVETNLGQEFSLSIGQTASIQGEQLKLKFLEVVNDSRCPSDVTCIWQGQASSLIEITYQGSTQKLTLVQPGLTEEPTQLDFNDYLIEFNLTPYPQAGEEIKKSDYRLQMVVTKRPLLSGGILVTFDVSGETYKIFVTNEDTIADIYALQSGTSQASIPSGRIVRGVVPYNAPWSWHIDSEDIHMAEVTIELCDGTPSQVEANLDYWVDTVKRFCPWTAQITSIEDYR